MDEIIRNAEHHCAACGYKCDSLSGVPSNPQGAPQIGEICWMICANCSEAFIGTPTAFGWTTRLPTPEEKQEMINSPWFIQARAAWIAVQNGMVG